MKLVPFDEVVQRAREWAELGAIVHQRFACEACGNDTLGIEEPNTFYEFGKCDKCGHTTNLKKTGCNYLLIAKL
jgi:ribosomal protein L37AE/L43A